MNNKKIFVDMDGVLADFNKRYREVFNMESLALREQGKHKEYRHNWKKIVHDGHFETLDFEPGAEKLINYLNGIKAEKIILSSTAGYEFYNIISDQKRKWLEKHNIDWPRVFVPGKKYKKGFADPDSILIDDTLTNVEDFVIAGGAAIQHYDINVTMPKLYEWRLRNNVT